MIPFIAALAKFTSMLGAAFEGVLVRQQWL
jgi:hypothetical protein